MIKTPKPNPLRDALDNARFAKEQAEKLESPSALGPRHDAHVRERWNAKAAEWRAAERKYRAEAKALRAMKAGV